MNYLVELTPTQLHALARACEVAARIKIGQLGTATDLVGLEDRDGKDCCDYELEKALDRLVKQRMGLDLNASWGVGKYPESDVWFDLQSAFRHRLAWDRAYAEGIVTPGAPRQWPEMMGVDFDEPMHWGDQPLPKISTVEEDA